jgi:hypothetical protein
MVGGDSLTVKLTETVTKAPPAGVIVTCPV